MSLGQHNLRAKGRIAVNDLKVLFTVRYHLYNRKRDRGNVDGVFDHRNALSHILYLLEQDASLLNAFAPVGQTIQTNFLEYRTVVDSLFVLLDKLLDLFRGFLGGLESLVVFLNQVYNTVDFW